MTQDVGLPAGTRSVVLLDSENLFHDLVRVAPAAVDALESWCRRKLPPPRVTTSYGKARDRYVQRSRARGVELGHRVVDVDPGKDKADEALLEDLGRWASGAPTVLIGTGDLELCRRAVRTTHDTPARVDWVVVSATLPGSKLREFEGPTVLGEIGLERVQTLPQIFQWHFGVRLRRDAEPVDRPLPRRPHPLPDVPPHIDWARLNPGPTPIDSPLWRARAMDEFRFRGLSAGDAHHLAELLSRWLPCVIGADRIHDDHGADPDLWEFHCLTAVGCAALTPEGQLDPLAIAAWLRVREKHSRTARSALAEAELRIRASFGASRSETLLARYGPS